MVRSCLRLPRLVRVDLGAIVVEEEEEEEEEAIMVVIRTRIDGAGEAVEFGRVCCISTCFLSLLSIL